MATQTTSRDRYYIVQSDAIDWLEQPSYSAAVETALELDRRGEENVVIIEYDNGWRRSLLPDERETGS